MSENKGNKLEVFKFDKINIPQPTEPTNKSLDKPTPWGDDNNYPNFLMYLYDNCPVHANIIDTKTDFIIGDGIKYKNGKDAKVQINPEYDLQQLISLCLKEYLIYKAFAIEVVYNKARMPIEFHNVPLYKLRANEDKSTFWTSDNWLFNSKKSDPIAMWKPNSTDGKTKIFFFTDSINGSNIYPKPSYHACTMSIVADINLRISNLHNIQNQFSVGHIFTVYNGGNPSDEQKQDTLRKIKDVYTGVQGNKIIVDFQNDSGKPTDVKDLTPIDWYKPYEVIDAKINKDILAGHSIIAPVLFGQASETPLGGSGNEYELAYEIFQTTKASVIRNKMLAVLNPLLNGCPLLEDEIIFAEKQLFAASISETLKEKILTLNEMRDEQGMPPLPNGDRLLSDPIQTATAAPVQMSSHVFQLSEEDFDKIKDLGFGVDEFDFIEQGEFIKTHEDFNKVEMHFETVAEISKYIIDNKLSDLSLKELKASLRKDLGINVSLNELKGMLEQLTKSGVIDNDVQDDKVKINPDKSNPNKQIEVMYSYDVRPGYGKEVIENTRPFCKKLIENNRFYTRAEIQTMTSIFGYDIYSYGGGFYRDPNSGDVTPHCRHFFKAVSVSRKSK